MATSDITNANARLIGFSQYRQLRFLRPPPPTLNAGNDVHASHPNLSDLILVSALVLVLMLEHRLTGSFSKIRSPDAHDDPAPDARLTAPLPTAPQYRPPAGRGQPAKEKFKSYPLATFI